MPGTKHQRDPNAAYKLEIHRKLNAIEGQLKDLRTGLELIGKMLLLICSNQKSGMNISKN